VHCQGWVSTRREGVEVADLVLLMSLCSHAVEIERLRPSVVVFAGNLLVWCSRRELLLLDEWDWSQHLQFGDIDLDSSFRGISADSEMVTLVVLGLFEEQVPGGGIEHVTDSEEWPRPAAAEAVAHSWDLVRRDCIHEPSLLHPVLN